MPREFKVGDIDVQISYGVMVDGKSAYRVGGWLMRKAENTIREALLMIRDERVDYTLSRAKIGSIIGYWQPGLATGARRPSPYLVLEMPIKPAINDGTEDHRPFIVLVEVSAKDPRHRAILKQDGLTPVKGLLRQLSKAIFDRFEAQTDMAISLSVLSGNPRTKYARVAL